MSILAILCPLCIRFLNSNDPILLQIQDMIQEALDALPETGDSDFKLKINLNEIHKNGDQTSNFGNQPSSGISKIDLALCQLADDELLAEKKEVKL